MNNKQLIIDETLVRRLVATQFPQWKALPIRSVTPGGWDNRTFHLGEHMLVRLPSAARYATQVEKEQQWLPKLAPELPLPIPEPLAIGEPTDDYPWRWSIYHWLNGTPAAVAPITSLSDFAKSLAKFLITLQNIDTTDGPPPGPDNFYRGGALINYDTETREMITALQDKIDINTTIDVWETAIETSWHNAPVWIHGDIAAANLLVQEGKLCAVIDFGQLAIGDPACDLSITWTLFKGKSRERFRAMQKFDTETWARARAWTLWKALTYIANNQTDMNVEAKQAWHIIDEVLADHVSPKLD